MEALISCRQTTSGCALSSHSRNWVWRARIPFTFQVAIFMSSIRIAGIEDHFPLAVRLLLPDGHVGPFAGVAFEDGTVAAPRVTDLSAARDLRADRFPRQREAAGERGQHVVADLLWTDQHAAAAGRFGSVGR